MEHGRRIVGDYIYNLNDVIGSGAWSTVYRGARVNLPGCKQYAIKKMNKFKIENDDKSMLKYQSEVIALQKTQAITQIIEIIDFFKSKSHYYIITKYHLNSLDLYEYMRIHSNKFCEGEARVIWTQLLQGILALHRLNISHRDLKLQNIVYGQGKVHIIDFGTATYLTNEAGLVGSPLFMSPQIMQGKKYTKKCDIWSLGVIFYYMLCKQSPFGLQMDQHSILNKVHQIRQKGVTYPHNKMISKGAKQVIEGCLKYDESKRMQLQDILNLPFFCCKGLKMGDMNATYEPKLYFKH